MSDIRRLIDDYHSSSMILDNITWGQKLTNKIKRTWIVLLLIQAVFVLCSSGWIVELFYRIFEIDSCSVLPVKNFFILNTDRTPEVAQLLSCPEYAIRKVLPAVGGYQLPLEKPLNETITGSVKHLEEMFDKMISSEASLSLQCNDIEADEAKNHTDQTAQMLKKNVSIAIAIIGVLDNVDTSKFSLRNKREYAVKHGYDVVVVDGLRFFDHHPAWAKVPLLFSMLHKYDYIWSLDLDTMILRDVPLENIITPGYDIIITEDSFGLNTGSFIIKASDWSKVILMYMWGQRTFRGSLFYWEQTPLQCIFSKYSQVRQHMHVVERNVLNSYESDVRKWNQRSESDKEPFVLHFAGDKNKWAKLKEYSFAKGSPTSG